MRLLSREIGVKECNYHQQQSSLPIEYDEMDHDPTRITLTTTNLKISLHSQPEEDDSLP
jgi:hypothetical protein